MNIVDLLKAIYANDQVRILAVLILADLVLGVFASLLDKSFTLAKIADWLTTSVLPMVVAYGVGSLLTIVGPQLSVLSVNIPPIRDLAFYTLTASLAADILGKLKGLGIPGLAAMPSAIAGPKP